MSAEDSLMPTSEGGKIPQNYNVESGQAKFTKDSESVDVQATTKLIGLTKEQLEQYRNDPFWKPVRYVLFALFWLVWLAMFVGAVLIVVLSPKCAVKTEPKYHENLVAYQIFTPTFRDSDGDGVGDLKGVKEKLNDLRKIGVSAVWPTPIVSTNKDDYLPMEVMDITEVDPRYGSHQDLEALVEATHSAGLHFIMDLPLTVSKHNTWANGIPDSTFPDKNSNTSVLNVANDKVQEKLVEAARKFLKIGVDGFHFADYDMAKKIAHSIKPLNPIIAKIRNVAAEDPQIAQKDVLFTTEPEWRSATAENNSTETYQVLRLAEGPGSALLDRVDASVEAGVQLVGDNSSVPPIWQLSDIGSPRIDQLLANEPGLREHSTEVSTLLSLIQLFLPGPVNVYYGQEIGLPSNAPAGTLPPQLGTMRWESAGPNVGFSSFTGQNFFSTVDNTTNAVFEVQYNDATSPLKAFKRLAELRSRDVVFQRGSFAFTRNSDGLHIYSRYLPDSTTENVYVLAVNWPVAGNAAARTLRLTEDVARGRSTTNVEVKVPPVGNSAYHQNQDLDIEKEPVVIQPYSGLVIRLL
ncbi:alpha amylase, catalytic domain-containing protein [Ditylenchus destructor]|uniref:Alpha amylase, catalytic domain-containing protein n=1 Tax=Ditylenchus destructor TaxID=166010 RepID=A0AAD4R7N5_9BILA|nr:alpha amylase, catalytic domain-containing protein [Ditylenchus destructor]